MSTKKKYEENYERIFAKKQAYDSIFRKTKKNESYTHGGIKCLVDGCGI
jgi:hypothetical protein